MLVYTLAIEHKYGTAITVYKTEEKRRAALVQWCRDWWDETGLDKDEMPQDEEMLITTYFGDHDRESYVLDSTELEDC